MSKQGHGKITAVSCSTCVHHSVCSYKEDFLDVYNAVLNANVNKCEGDGKVCMKNVMNYDFLDEIVIKCKHYYDGAKIRIDSGGMTFQPYPQPSIRDYCSKTTADNPNVGYTLTNNETKIVNVNNQL